MPFAQALQERVIVKLRFRHTAPNPQSRSVAISGHDRAASARWAEPASIWLVEGRPVLY
jgi:hypothetical protein